MEVKVMPFPVRHRFWIPCFALFAAGMFMAVLWSLSPEGGPIEGNRWSMTILASILAGAVVVLWFLLFSRFSMLTRFAGLIVLGLIGFGATKVVRRIEFTGNMEPSLETIWSVDRQGVLDDYLEKEGSVTAESTVDLSLPKDDDSPEYRGVKRDGVVKGNPLNADSFAQSSELWRHPVGGGYAGVSIVMPWGVTIEQRGKEEAVVCYDVQTGKQRWVHSYPALFSEQLGGDGPRATPTIVGGKVYSLGAMGDLVCLNGADGSVVWQVKLLDDNKSPNLQWGMCGSPLVVEGRLIVSPGSAPQGTGGVIALDSATGQEVWRSGNHKGGYASPHLATLGGIAQVLVFDGEGISSYALADGAELWRHPWKSDFDVNASQPLLLSDTDLFITSNAGGARLSVSLVDGRWSVQERWKNRFLKGEYASPVLHGGHIYGLDLGILVCLDAETGNKKWKGGRFGHGQVLLRSGQIVILSEQGEVALVEANPVKLQVLGKFQGVEGKTWNNPSLVGSLLVIRNDEEMAAFRLR
jgi:outer membrane protein assembly factor BamB